ncbi:MAG: helix-turn-helix domain-containing protein [Clostridiales bacterium]|nr:helix-turn-helix domain-containing protein [Clostridiales bacterium]MDE6200388.1 helix-turn-helix domain-containing protein [Clostridiales bacterium]
MTISNRIFALLKEQHKTQTDVANAIGVRQATVSAWKAQNTNPSADLIAPIAAYLGVSCDYLCTGEEYTPAARDVKQGIFGNGNNNNAVTIHDGAATAAASEFEQELLRIYGSLDAKRKNALLTFAYNLESEGGNV